MHRPSMVYVNLIIDVVVWFCRYEKLAEQEELNYQQQRRRLFGEIAQEKEKLAEQSLRQKATLDLKLKENAELHDRYLHVFFTVDQSSS